MIIETLIQQIKTIPHAQIQMLLLNQLNKEAKVFELAFHKNASVKPIEGNQKLPSQDLVSPLAIAFAYGPQSLCDSLIEALYSLNHTEALNLVQTTKLGFQKLFLASSKKTRIQLAGWAAHLPSKSLVKLFTDGNGFFSQGLEAPLRILAEGEFETLANLFTAFGRLNPEDLFNLFLSQSIPLRFAGLIRLFEYGIKDEQTALSLLDLISPLSDNALFNLFYSPANYATFIPADSLLRHLNHYSFQVIFKILNLLNRFSDDEIEKLFLAGNSNAQIEVPFLVGDAHTFGNDLAIAYLNLLKRSDKLITILYKPDHSFLHQLVQHQYLKALAYYLEQDQLAINHTNDKGQTAYQLAKDLKSLDARALFEAQVILQGLTDYSDDTHQQLRALIEQDTTLLKTSWSSELSLAHYSILYKNPRALSLFLAHGASAKVKNADGLNLLDYALSRGDFASLWILLEHLNQHEFELGPLLAQGFKHIHRLKQASKALKQYLSTVNQNIGLLEGLKTYCKTHQDKRSLFLLYVGSSLKQTPSALSQAASIFIKEQLKKGADPLEREETNLQLIVFFFTIEPSILLKFLNKLKLTPSKRIQLDLIICQGLLQAQVYSSLSVADQIQFEDCLLNKTLSLNSIISTHFRQSDLTLLPPKLLLHYAKELNHESLYQLSMNRFHGVLFVLVLNNEEAFLEDVQETPLLQKFKRKLLSLNASSPPHLKELHLMLNLAHLEPLKKFIKHFIEQHAGLQQACELLFGKFHHSHTLVDKGLLRELLIDFGRKISLIQKPKLKPAFTELLIAAKPQEVLELVKAQLQPESNSLIYQAIIQGIIAHPNYLDLVNMLFKWAIEHPFTTELLEHMPQFLETIPDWGKIDALFAKALTQPKLIQDPLSEHYQSNLQLFSCLLLKEGLYRPGVDEVRRLTSFSTLIQSKEGFFSLQASSLWLDSYLPILKQEITATTLAFMNAFALLLKYSPPSLQASIIHGLPLEDLESLLSHCLLGIHSNDECRAQSCGTILTYLAHSKRINHQGHTNLIQGYLGQYDTAILREETLIQISESILKAASKTLEEETFSGIWIARLLVTPLFLAHANKDLLRQLIERLRIIISTLKQDEYESLSRFINSKISYQIFGEEMVRWRASVLNDPKRRSFFEEKLYRLVQFKDEHSIRELLLQAMAAIEEAPKNIAEPARKTLYSYYNQEMSNQCSNFLFQKTSNFLYWTSEQLGDPSLAKNNLYQWINQYLPYLNFERELSDKYQNKLYNETGEVLGFINDAHYALSPQHELLIEIDGIKPGLEFFNLHGQILGILKANGEMERINLFKKTTAAYIIGTVPIKELLDSKAELKLLLHDILMENSIKVLYECEALRLDRRKRLWVEGILTEQFTLETQGVPAESIQAMLDHHQKEWIELLSKITLRTNALDAFQAILLDETRRKNLFKNKAQVLGAFLEKVGPEVVLQDFLAQHQEKPWFVEGLKCLAGHFKHRGVVLSNALNEFDPQSPRLKQLMHNILNKEALTEVILNEFFQDKHASIQAFLPKVSREFTSLFNKEQIIPCLQDISLQKEQVCWNSARYRLVLIIIAHQQEFLFAQQELRYSTQAWSGQELGLLSRFVRIHFANKNNPDEDFQICRQLLSLLVFFRTDLGETDLFYTVKGKFNPKMAYFNLERSKLDWLVSQLHIPDDVKNRISNPVTSLRNWFDSNHSKRMEIHQYLKDNNALVNWKNIASKSWSLVDGQHLPLFLAFLFNYIGPAKALERLLDDFISSPQLYTDSKYLHALSKLLTKIPHQPIATLIFLSFARHPKQMDEMVVRHLAYYYQKVHLQSKNIQDPVQSILDLILYFGQVKDYAAAAQCCLVLKFNPKLDETIRETAQKIHISAKVEGELNTCKERWWFKLLRFFKRLWNYTKDPSPFIRPCDEPSLTPVIEAPLEIGEKTLGGKFHEEQKSFLCKLKKTQFYQDHQTKKQAAQTASNPLQQLSVFKPNQEMPPTERNSVST